MINKIDFISSHLWYTDHLRPVWAALPEERRGHFFLPGEKPTAAKTPTLVAASGDMNRAHRSGRPVAMMEHGAGQSYGGDRRSTRHSSYAGGDNRKAELFLHPGPHPASRDRARYPESRVEVIGCPKLDFLPKRDHSLDVDDRPVVAVSFHWDCVVCQETRSSFVHFRNGIKETTDFKLIGHAHPRMTERLRPWYQRKRIEFVPTFEEVLKRADLYACDNSSSLFEFAATRRPVVVMNPPFYRKTVNHGLRFWEAAHVGWNVTNPSELTDIMSAALTDPESRRLAREDALDKVYTPRTGGAALAAGYLIDWVDTR